MLLKVDIPTASATINSFIWRPLVIMFWVFFNVFRSCDLIWAIGGLCSVWQPVCLYANIAQTFSRNYWKWRPTVRQYLSNFTFITVAVFCLENGILFRTNRFSPYFLQTVYSLTPNSFNNRQKQKFLWPLKRDRSASHSNSFLLKLAISIFILRYPIAIVCRSSF